MNPFAVAAQSVWGGIDGKPMPETPARKAKNGFGVSISVTADPDWQAKWETPVHVRPNFTIADTVRTGESLTVLTFVVNPKPDLNNNIKVVSHVQVMRPDGRYSLNQSGMPCQSGALSGPATNVRMCEAVIQFNADPGDPEGIWKVKVTVRDENRALEIPVEAEFKLVAR